MKKKIIALILTAICIVLYGYRVYSVNSDTEQVKIKTYTLGETAPFEKDYNSASNMIIDGYRAEILESNIYEKEEFIKEYNITESIDKFTKFFYVVDVRFYNDNKEDNTDSGLFLLFYPLITDVDYIMPEEDLTLKLNKNLSEISFSLRHESSMDVKIVYALNEPYFTSEKQVMKKDFKMLITQYPTRKLLDIR